MEKSEIKLTVRQNYANIARGNSSCCGAGSSCCGSSSAAEEISKAVGYSDQDITSVPEGANLGLGCGNPVAMASLEEGEVVLDLGSGAGFDCFLAAKKVGKNGRVIGVDMTPEMLEKARRNARQGDYSNVEFRLGEIENLPVADASVDAIISNCVINLSPEKERVFRESFRVLKPGGRLMISDMVLVKELPEKIKSSVTAYVGCIAGAILQSEYIDLMRKTGFDDIQIKSEISMPIDLIGDDSFTQSLLKITGVTKSEFLDAVDTIKSIKIHGVKPC